MSRSGYKPLHSAETALSKVRNDNTTSVDKDKVTVPTLLDLSAAFDTKHTAHFMWCPTPFCFGAFAFHTANSQLV